MLITSSMLYQYHCYSVSRTIMYFVEKTLAIPRPVGELHYWYVVSCTILLCSELHYWYVVNFTTLTVVKLHVVSFTTMSVVTPVAEYSLHICSDAHYFVFTV